MKFFNGAELLGKTIQNARKQKGMELVELAKVLNISPAYLIAIERESRGLNEELMKKISSVLDISYEELTSLTQEVDDGILRNMRTHGIAVNFAKGTSQEEKERFFRRLEEINQE